MMNLKVKINNKVFEGNLVQDCTFTEEYTETLDSATIILAQVPKIKNLRPYDDVFIYDGDFRGFDENGNILGYNITFYKHLLVDQFTEERLNLKSDLYKYKIQLFSETKGLETVQLPNISITQPLDFTKKISVLNYLNQFINMYSPKIKVSDDEYNQTWVYKNKYKLSNSVADLLDGINGETMEEVFGNDYTPDFTLNNPNLKDVLAKLMIVKDRIPVVYNNVIYAMDITKRRGNFDFNAGNINYVVSSNSSSNYADNLRRTYSGALSQDRTCKMVEYLGFRNKDTALMKIADLRIETGFPIYKINKVYMCYYKKSEIYDEYGEKTGEEKAFLCKQDITPLVKLNSERNLLSKDFDDLEKKKDQNFVPLDIEEASKYKFATIGYDIGSNYITGWGERYKYIKSWRWEEDKTILENIFSIVDYENPFGIYGRNYLYGETKSGEQISIENRGKISEVLSPYTNNSLKLKGFFFIVEYDAFYDGTIIHTKDLATGDVVMNDNSSSSLTLLEMDGLAQKEKINRFGNKNYTIPARYTDYSQIQGLGTCYDDDENDTDIIIYRKEYSISGNVINCTYSGMKDYVLKNYFTSVYAKHRPYNLMSYGESVTRAENKKIMLLLSKGNLYFENSNSIFFNSFEDENYLKEIFSFLNVSTISDDLKKENEKNINYAYLEFTLNNQRLRYASDLNAFVSGNSMCFNMTMTDNVSMGVYVKKAMPFENDENFTAADIKDPENDYTGTLQTWHMITDETGFIKNIGFYVSHSDQNDTFIDKVISSNDYDINDKINELYDKIFLLPKINKNDFNLSNIIGNTFEINKDNKEIINMTYQIEPITIDENIIISPWLMKLSDLIGNYNKFDEDQTRNLNSYSDLDFEIYATTIGVNEKNDASPAIFVSVDNSDFVYLKPGVDLISKNKVEYNDTTNKASTLFSGEYIYFNFELLKVIEVTFVDSNGEQYNEYKDGYKLLSIVFAVKYKTIFKKSKIAGGKEETTSDVIFVKFDNVKISSPANQTGFNWYVHENKTLLSPIKFFSGGFRKWNDNDPFNFHRYGYCLKNGYFLNPWEKGENDIEVSIDENNSQMFRSIVKDNEEDLETYKMPKNIFIIFDTEKMNKNIIYREFSGDIINYSGNDIVKEKFKNNLNNNIDKKVNDFIFLQKDEYNSNYLSISTKDLDNIKSIQMWYLDGIENGVTPNLSKASYKFVLGVNITEEDIENGEVKIYISNISTLNKKVYDSKNNLIGNVTDFIKDNEKEYKEKPNESRTSKDSYTIKIPKNQIEILSDFDFSYTEKFMVIIDNNEVFYESEIIKKDTGLITFRLLKKSNYNGPTAFNFELNGNYYECELSNEYKFANFEFYNSKNYYHPTTLYDSDKKTITLSLPLSIIYDYEIRGAEPNIQITQKEDGKYVTYNYLMETNKDNIKKYYNINPGNIEYFTFKIHSKNDTSIYYYINSNDFAQDFEGNIYDFDKVLDEFYEWYSSEISPYYPNFNPNIYMVSFEITFKKTIPNNELDLDVSGFKQVLFYGESGSPYSVQILNEDLNKLTNIKVPGTGKTRQITLRFDADLRDNLNSFKTAFNNGFLRSNILPTENIIPLSLKRVETTGGLEKIDFELNDDNVLVNTQFVESGNDIMFITFEMNFKEEKVKVYKYVENEFIILSLSNKFIEEMYKQGIDNFNCDIQANIKYFYKINNKVYNETFNYNGFSFGIKDGKYYLTLTNLQSKIPSIEFIQENENDYYNVAKIPVKTTSNNEILDDEDILDFSFTKFELKTKGFKDYGEQHYTTFEELEAE